MTTATLNGIPVESTSTVRPVAFQEVHRSTRPKKDLSQSSIPAVKPEPAKPQHTDIVLEAFDHVAMDFSVTLPRLLQECNLRGLTDAEAKAALIELENVYQDNERTLFANRNPAGEAFIRRDSGAEFSIASMRELFAGLPKPKAESLPSKFAKLTISLEQEQLLLCCKACTSFFTCQNVVTLVAVQSLMYARHSVTKKDTKRIVRELVARGILMEIETHGAEGLRLTSEVSQALTGGIQPSATVKPEVREAVVEKTEETSEDADCIESLHAKAIENYGNLFSENTVRFIAIFQTCCEMDHVRLINLFRFCETHGMKNTEVRRAIGELSALEYVFVEWCQNANAYFLTMCNLDSPNRQPWDLISAFDEISKELTA